MKTRMLTTTMLAFLLAALTPLGHGAELLDHWTWRNPLPTGVGFGGITHGKRLYVAGSDVGTILEASTNFTDWSAVANAIVTNGTGVFTDSSSANFDRRCYRVVSPP